MLPKKQSLKALRKFFKTKPVAEIVELLALLNTTSRMSVFRRLKELGYLSSYTHAGRYYTLSAIPCFNSLGLWCHKGIGFSKYGSLKATVIHLIHQSDAGMTHQELETHLHVRVHNALLELVQSKQIKREPSAGMYLYVSAEWRRANEQVTRRKEIHSGRKKSPLPAWIAIEVLAEAIRESQIRGDSREIADQLLARGIVVTAEQVDQVFEQYHLKKNGLRHRQSVEK